MRSLALTRPSWPLLARDCFIYGGWLPALVLALHAAGVLLFNAYARWPAFDIPMHFGGGFAVAFFCLRSADLLMARNVLRRIDDAVLYVLVFALTATAAVHWEFLEWLADARFGVDSQVGLNDTILDMLLGVLGGLTLLWVMAPKRMK